MWVTEDLAPIPRKIYGVTKRVAEDLCELFHRDHGLACLVLRTSRFFLEPDDQEAAYPDDNVKANEYLHRRVDEEYARRGWTMFPGIDRVYVNERARQDLGWRPRHDFGYVLGCLKVGEDPRSPLARAVGSKGYHAR